MTTSEIRQLIEFQAQQLGPSLHLGVATALAGAIKRTQGLDRGKYPHLLPLTMRAEMREFLETNRLAAGWKVAGDPRLMGQLLLAQDEHRLELRFLKERRRTYPGGVPAAGPNRSRREVWGQLPLDFPVPIAAELMGPVRLLLLWDTAGSGDDLEFSLRIVHTIAAGVYGSAVPCDLILDVNDGGEIFKHLEFAGSPDEDHDFFVVDIDREENESGA